jgi:HD-GYP domain-containing protein (c-di-GMP phosphodiesterase class II)
VFRLLGLLGGLSVATDLGSGAPMEEALQRAVVAARLARALGCPDSTVSDTIYTSLLQHLGCTAYAHEAAAMFGDDIAVTRTAFLMDGRPSDVVRTWAPRLALATGQSRARAAATLIVSGRRLSAQGPIATCEVARGAARRLGLPETVQTGLFEGLAQWNGKGYPPKAGDEISASSRIMQVASTAVLICSHADREAAIGSVRRRSGSLLDPRIAEAFCDNASDLLDDLADIDAYAEVLDLEPDPVRRVDDGRLESVARTFGDLADLKSPWLLGHSSAVSALAEGAATALGIEAVGTVRVAGLLHDLGRVAVSSRIWDKAGPLSVSERDQVQLHPYHTGRILARVPELAQVAVVASQHHERTDGSGYYRGARAADLGLPSRVLAAADAYRCQVEDRPYRAGLSEERAADRLRAAVAESRLDGDAVAAVLAAAGHREGSRRTGPAGLTERQVEVLRLVAAGRSNREIARQLVISQRTAEHHVQDVYARIGVSSRAGAALFAMEHGLLG